MEKIIDIHIEKLPEGLYLVTSDKIQGLLAQGRTITETLEIASDVEKKILEAHENEKSKRFTTLPNHTGDMPEGTLKAILKQADISIEDFFNLKLK